MIKGADSQSPRDGEALASAMAAIKADPLSSTGWESAAHLLLTHKKWHEARDVLALAITAVPDNALLHAYHALALTKTGALAQASAASATASRLAPALPQAMLARIEILNETGQYDLARDESLKLPAHLMPETAAFTQGAALFMTGDYTNGMTRLLKAIASDARDDILPAWNGEKLAGALLIYGSQGFGDWLHFARYIPLAVQRTPQIILQVAAPLLRLMRDSFPTLAVISDQDSVPAEAQARCNLPTLVTLSDNGFSFEGDSVPYLRADPARVALWRERLRDVATPRIGLVWSSPWQMNSPARILTLDTLRPLIDHARPHIVSLQRGAEQAEAQAAALFDATAMIDDFADSAALMECLDVIITLDSAPAHLAGALGKTAWVMLPFNADWRWLIARSDSPWYKTLHLFRQQSPGDWGSVMQAMRPHLDALLS